MAVPYTFGTATSSIPLTQLDSNFATAITLGSTNVYLGNTTTTLVGFANLSSTLITSPTHNSSTTLSLQTGGTTGLYIDASQNVGIGTTSPGAKLEIAKASGAADIRLSVAGTLYANVFAGASSFTILSVPAIPLTLGTNNTESMRIDSSGNLLVGTTSQIRSSKLSVVGNVYANGFFVGSTTSNLYIYEGSTNILTFLVGNTGSFKYFSFDTSGNGNAVNGSWVNGSDARLKENIKTIDKGLSEVLSLRPVSYNRIGAEQTEIGFIAQEVQSIIPEVVHDTGEYLGISYGNITAVLVAACQEQQKLIVDLQERLAKAGL